VPKGTYLYADGAREVFSCAPGVAGWRYVSQTYDASGAPLGRVDLTVDERWRQVRVLVSGGGWTVRGGLVGPDAVWVRVPDGVAEGEERSLPAAGFTGRSPAFAVATANLLGLDLLDRRRVRLVGVSEPALATLPVDEGWALVDVTEHDTESGPLPVRRYEVADLATAERRVVHLAGDVLLEGEGVELADLESPPNL
jgi:hypothetical protein